MIRADGGALSGRRAGPAVPRVVLGAQLRRLREAAGVGRDEAGATIRASGSKIARLELGRTGVRPRDVADLLTLYGVDADAERATLLALTGQCDEPGWWQPYEDVVPEWLRDYLGLEQAASLVRTYEVQLIPGLLQTESYARAVIAHGRLDDVERRVELRMKRQEVLRRPAGPRLWAVIDEAALRRPICGLATMRAQLRHLIDMSRLPNVTIQVMPFHTGGHAGLTGPFTVLRLPGSELPDVVYQEHLTGACYPDRRVDVEHHWDVMNRLVTAAEPPIATPAILDRIIGHG